TGGEPVVPLGRSGFGCSRAGCAPADQSSRHPFGLWSSEHASRARVGPSRRPTAQVVGGSAPVYSRSSRPRPGISTSGRVSNVHGILAQESGPLQVLFTSKETTYLWVIFVISLVALAFAYYL